MNKNAKVATIVAASAAVAATVGTLIYKKVKNSQKK